MLIPDESYRVIKLIVKAVHLATGIILVLLDQR